MWRRDLKISKHVALAIYYVQQYMKHKQTVQFASHSGQQILLFSN